MKARADIGRLLERRPSPRIYRNLWDWIYLKLGIRLATRAVCKGHTSPYDIIHYKFAKEPSSLLVHGPRGGGKSMGAALSAHLECRWRPGYKVRILGGSKDQSRQVYEAIEEKIVNGDEGRPDPEPFESVTAESARYKNQAHIKILAASRLQTRGPHVPYLILDEIDEQLPERFQNAVGMVQEYPKRGWKPRIEMLSTWHNVGGLMERKIREAEDTGMPFFRFCLFEIMERCPDSYSGPNLEMCPTCPIFKHCWADRFNDMRLPPRAKVCDGHYTLESVLQKVHNIGIDEFKSDFLCIGPKVHGRWFTKYDDSQAAADPEYAEYDPDLPVEFPIDYGVHTGAVAFQVKKRVLNGMVVEDCCVFADYYSEGLPAALNARNLIELAEGRFQGRRDRASMDPAAKAREGSGAIGRSEYAQAGLEVVLWPRVQNKLESLALIDSFILTAAETRHLFIHPRCKHLRRALQNYKRKKSGAQYLNVPEDPQHPEEELIDALAGGLSRLYPQGRADIFRGRLRLPLSYVH